MAIGQRVADCRLDRQGLLASEVVGGVLEVQRDAVAVAGTNANGDRIVDGSSVFVIVSTVAGR
ncbi:hypothetical protein [Natronosalvus caseinilyticus]|uniref:hypothetical protein n=1 Tax=Natronosalvus caseinilyticus TaxID=2953747 RepID=UPI0028B2093A|nr:hypothetical protein [Natronosalvus caseinilyticus]